MVLANQHDHLFSRLNTGLLVASLRRNSPLSIILPEKGLSEIIPILVSCVDHRNHPFKVDQKYKQSTKPLLLLKSTPEDTKANEKHFLHIGFTFLE